MIPAFHGEKNGYNKREVDEWVDTMLEEHHRLTSLNEQLMNDGAVHYAEPSPIIGDGMAKEKESEKTSSWISAVLFNLFFYTIIIVAVVGVFLFRSSGGNRPPQDIFGYSVMTILTRSMHDVIPQDSVIVTKQVDPNTIQVGDDITYLMSNNTTVTHRVMAIYDNYAGTGAPGFETQGTMNERPDAEIVIAANVVGKVIFHNQMLGRGILFIRTHILWIGILAGLLMALSMVLRIIFAKGKEERKEHTQVEKIHKQQLEKLVYQSLRKIG